MNRAIINSARLSPHRLSGPLVRAGAVVTAVILALGLATLAGPTRPATAAAEDAGVVEFRSPSTSGVLTSGGSSTEFGMAPPQGAACPGSGSGTPAYRWQTFFVSAAVDVASLTFASGPNPVAGQFVSPMYDNAGGTAVINKNPAANPLGLIAGIPTVSFAAFTPAGTVAPGDYKVGFACTQAGSNVRFWTIRITVTADASDSPAGFTWVVAAPPVATTTTTIASTSTTVAPAATSTTTKPATTSTTASGSTTTSVAGGPVVTAGNLTPAPGSDVAFTASGFVAGSTVTFDITGDFGTVNNADLRSEVATTQTLGTAVADASGVASKTFKAPDRTGSYTVRATSGARTASMVINVTVVLATTIGSSPVTPTTASGSGSLPTQTTQPKVLATTGSSSIPLVVWAILLLVVGRIAILVARPLRLRPPKS